MRINNEKGRQLSSGGSIYYYGPVYYKVINKLKIDIKGRYRDCAFRLIRYENK